MRNEWLEDFRLELYSLGRAIWDYQEDVPGALLDVYHELQRVAQKVVKEFFDLHLTHNTKDRLIKGCVLHITVCDIIKYPDGTTEAVPHTSLLDKIDLQTNDPFAYVIYHMNEYMRSA